ncbi:MAG: nucleotidyltransferase [Sphingopyxis sp.]|nr:nucleotidyltransferase [Sphingopyxis sp.]
MAISETQLETWSHQGSVVQSAATYETIRNALQDARAPFASKSFDIFLQGSYGNDTNIFADSDVDIVIRLSSIYYHDISGLNTDEQTLFNQNRVPGTYSFNDFKAEVLDWLTTKFGSGVKAGSKAIYVPGNGSRREVDVLVCVEHRAYYKYDMLGGTRFNEGICFWTSKGEKIVNYPKQHMGNSTSKHQQTSYRFKPSIRTLKNMRNAMIADGYLLEGVAPSYFLEGMLYNVPSQLFVNSRAQTFVNYINWLDGCEHSKLVCANERYYLLFAGDPVCWNETDYTKFRVAAVKYWNDA